MYNRNSSSVLSRSGPAAAVIGIHLLMAYVLTISMGVVEAPEFIEPFQAVFIPPDEPVTPEPEIPIVKPEIADVVQPVDEPMPQIEFDEPVVPPADVPMQDSGTAIDATVANASASSQELRTSRRVEPSYPPSSRRMGEEGTVRLRILVDARGMPQDVQLEKGSGFARLDAAAIEAVKRWRFVAATNAGQAISAWTQVAVTFRLTSQNSQKS